MVHAIECNLPIDLQYNTGVRDLTQCCPVEYVEWLRQSFHRTTDIARVNLQCIQECQKTHYDQGSKSVKFNCGDWVIRHYLPAKSRKLQSSVRQPYLVLTPQGPTTYKVQETPDMKPLYLHVEHLDHYFPLDGIFPESWLASTKEPVNVGTQTLPHFVPSKPLPDSADVCLPIVPDDQIAQSTLDVPPSDTVIPLNTEDVPSQAVPVLPFHDAEIPEAVNVMQPVLHNVRPPKGPTRQSRRKTRQPERLHYTKL
jgi:hypothetical protein